MGGGQDGMRTPMGGWRTPMVGGMQSVLGGAGSVGGTTSTVSSGLAAARGTVLGLKLDKMSDSVTGQTVVDPKGYLTDLNSMKVSAGSRSIERDSLVSRARRCGLYPHSSHSSPPAAHHFDDSTKEGDRRPSFVRICRGDRYLHGPPSL